MFIKLTSDETYYTGEPLLVNVNNILGIRRCNTSDYTMIIFDTSNFIVKETPDEIIKLIKECEK
jgi:uncharacterized protein YlzI (FlbEa/FlbD family)